MLLGGLITAWSMQSNITGWPVLAVGRSMAFHLQVSFFPFDMPVEKPTKLMFGVKDLEVLHLTSVAIGPTEITEADHLDTGKFFPPTVWVCAAFPSIALMGDTDYPLCDADCAITSL